MSNVDWGTYDDQAAAADRETHKAMVGSEWQKWENGENEGRILPPLKGRSSPFEIVMEHNIKIPGLKYDLRFVCLGHGCAYCKKSDDLRASKNQLDRDFGFQMSAKLRAYFNWIDRSAEKSGPKKAAVSNTVYTELQKLRNGRWGDFSHPLNGYDLVVTKTPKGTPENNTQYDKLAVAPAPSGKRPLGTPEQMRLWAEMAHDIGKLPPRLSESEIQDKMQVGDGQRGGGQQRQIESGGGSAGRTIDQVIDVPIGQEDDAPLG